MYTPSMLESLSIASKDEGENKQSSDVPDADCKIGVNVTLSFVVSGHLFEDTCIRADTYEWTST